MIVDISKFQGEIDWDALAPKLDFAILKATGRSADERFVANALACQARGIPIHVYHYMYALTEAEARDEAEFLWMHASPWGPVSYVCDVEGQTLVSDAVTALVRTFIAELRRLGAARVGLYFQNSAYERLRGVLGLADWLWLARYGANDGAVPGPQYEPHECDLWQYTDRGRIAGISGPVDLNLLRGRKTLEYFRGGEEMAVKIGSARIDENGAARGGQAGDQTGKEVSTQNWYKHSKGWRVFRAKDPAAREKIAIAMELACDNPRIGYDQDQRLTLYNAAKEVGFDPGAVTRDCETDCSALVRVCCAGAGIELPNFNTASEPRVLLDSGAFDELTGSKYTESSDYLLRGDILVTRTQGHTVVVLSNGAKSGAPTALRRGDVGEAVRELQQLLIARDYDVGPDGADGDFGRNTETALRLFQADNGLTVDGEAGAATLTALKTAPQNPMERLWTITIRHVPQAEKDAMATWWPEMEANEE